CMQALQTPHRF
nr:immunoglobulin light chain junction region [Macaca mulatta]